MRVHFSSLYKSASVTAKINHTSNMLQLISRSGTLLTYSDIKRETLGIMVLKPSVLTRRANTFDQIRHTIKFSSVQFNFVNLSFTKSQNKSHLRVLHRESKQVQ